MKLSFFLAFAVSLLITSFSKAQRQPTAEEEALFSKLMSGINTRHVQWVKNTAKEANEKKLSPDDINNKAKEYAALGSMNGQDIEALAFLVLMQAAKSAREDLKAIMAKVKQSTNKKQNKGNCFRKCSSSEPYRLYNLTRLNFFKTGPLRCSRAGILTA